MKTQTTHTPTPWSVERDGNNEICVATQWGYIASLGLPKNKRQEEDAAYIVRAVNAHEKLLQCLKGAMMIVKALSSDNDTVFVKEAEQAIAKAEGK